MKIIPLIETDRLVLKPLDLSFCSDEYVSWLNYKDISKYLEHNGKYTKQLLENYLIENTNKSIYFWAIIIKGINKHIGNIKIYQ